MICRKRNIFFLHIPKTAGTSIEKLLFPGHSFGINPDYNSFYGWDNYYGWLNHLTYKEAIALDNNFFKKNPLVFTIVRNPWDRIVSEYHWKKSLINFELSFNEFVKLIYDKEYYSLSKFYKSEIAMLQHLRPQSEYFDSSKQISLFHFEKLNILKSFLRNSGIYFYKLPVLHFSNHKHYHKYYDLKIRKMVAEIYESDLHSFKYEFNI